LSLNINCKRIADPDGHNPALLLKGDWVIVEISDGRITGLGESSHSRNDNRCIQTIGRLFDRYVKNMDLTLNGIKKLESGPFSGADDFVEATAISGINQALYDLIARRCNVAVWQLFSHKKSRQAIPVYATINRALTSRTLDDYEKIVSLAVDQGFNAIKCAPFESVLKHGDQVRQSRYGLSVLESLRNRFPDLSIRVDFHERFSLDLFTKILPEVEAIKPHWLEAPVPAGPEYSTLKLSCKNDIALGELFFGLAGFRNIVENQWADVIMPDIKHVGGLGPMVNLLNYSEGKIQVSPHNPSGPAATALSVHAAMLSQNVTSLEVPLIINPRRAYYLKWLDKGCFKIPCNIERDIENLFDSG